MLCVFRPRVEIDGVEVVEVREVGHLPEVPRASGREGRPDLAGNQRDVPPKRVATRRRSSVPSASRGRQTISDEKAERTQRG